MTRLLIAMTCVLALVFGAAGCLNRSDSPAPVINDTKEVSDEVTYNEIVSRNISLAEPAIAPGDGGTVYPFIQNSRQVLIFSESVGEVGAFGFDVQVPEGASLVHHWFGESYENFTQIRAEDLGNGVVRVGGYSLNPVNIQGKQAVVWLRFDSWDSGALIEHVRVFNYVDNFEGFRTAERFRARGSMCASVGEIDPEFPGVLPIEIRWNGEPIRSELWHGGGFICQFPTDLVDYRLCYNDEGSEWREINGGCNVMRPGEFLLSLDEYELAGNVIRGNTYIALVHFDGLFSGNRYPGTIWVPDGAHLVTLYFPFDNTIDRAGQEYTFTVTLPNQHLPPWQRDGWGDFDGMTPCELSFTF